MIDWKQTFRRFLCVAVCLTTGMTRAVDAEPPPRLRPGLQNIDWETPEAMTPEEATLVAALERPMITGMNVQAALECWFDGRAAVAAGDAGAAGAAFARGLDQLGDVQPLPKPEWAPNPDGTLELLKSFSFPENHGVRSHIVVWTVANLKQHGILLAPESPDRTRRFPLLLYSHGAAFGVPLYALPWLARMCREGYVIVGPAYRGETLFATRQAIPGMDYTCEGKIENLDGEVDDALSAVAGAFKLPFVQPGKFAIIGHSFGAGIGLLVTTRTTDVACMVSYDAWLTNPFRYVWDRMRRGPNNWLSWAEYCNQPVADQLAGLMKRSIVHNAERINCPLLLFMGGAYDGSVFHQSHADLIAELRKYGKDFTYDLVPDGGHNFVLYYDSKPATYAYAVHMEFLKTRFPPSRPDLCGAKAAPAAVAQPEPTPEPPATREPAQVK
jgi:dienelactone hydrolase